MDMGMLAILIPITAIVGGIVMIIYLRKYENTERMAMIERGVDASIFAREKKTDTGPLRASLLFIGAGLGLLLGYSLDRQFHMEAVGYFSMLFIFGGLGLGAAYVIEERKRKAEKESKNL